MKRFFRSVKKPTINKDITLKIIEWNACDETTLSNDDDDSDSEVELEEKEYVIRVFGATKDSESITVKITGFKPYYYIKVSDSFTTRKACTLLNFIENHYILKKFKNALDIKQSTIVQSKDMYGFNNDTQYTYVKLVFNSHSSMMRSRYIFKNPIHIFGVTQNETKFKLYESNFEPFMRYAHIQEILMAGWIKLPKTKFKQTYNEANTQLEYTINHKNVIPLDDMSFANFLQASWDIEVFSVDNSFPKPTVKENVIFQIATTYKYHSESKMTKHLLTLKHCSKIDDPDVVVEECKTEQELIKKFIYTIKKTDPDIMYTYNGDSFDCEYLFERAKLHGLDKYMLSELSRLTRTPAVIKKEVFSSSAYGDSEMHRLHIHGRLNYDLLIHYKRGMTKYSSYKLDNIAEAILGEKKNDVSVKEIFSFYKHGNPDKIRQVGLYCIQDTVLLQKLVDAQLILSSITQMANVTYVPISYLLTKGQTIKVLSQIYRKARQMGYLVPHTNFNENSFHYIISIPKALCNAKEGDCVNIQCGFKKSSGLIDKVLSTTKIEISINSELQDKNGVVIEHRGKKQHIETLEDSSREESFSGATVLTAIPGIYTNNIAILDFASLYPTIMISRNLCFSTFVMDNKHLEHTDVKYETIEWDDKISVKINRVCEAIMATGKNKGEACGKQAFFNVAFKYYCRIHDPMKKTREEEEKFQKKDVHYKYTIVQEGKDGKNKGIIPALLEELYYTRKKVKKQMSIAFKDGNSELGNILNSNQMAIKVSLNSTYGFLGRGKGNLILKELGSIVTSVGRMLIEQSKEYTENQFLEYIKHSNQLVHKIRPVENIHSIPNHQKEMILAEYKI